MKKKNQITYNDFEVTISKLLDSILNECYESAEEISNDRRIIEYWFDHDKNIDFTSCEDDGENLIHQINIVLEYLEDIISGEDEDYDEYYFDEDMIDEMEELSDSLSDLSSMIDYEVFKLSL